MTLRTAGRGDCGHMIRCGNWPVFSGPRLAPGCPVGALDRHRPRRGGLFSPVRLVESASAGSRFHTGPFKRPKRLGRGTDPGPIPRDCRDGVVHLHARFLSSPEDRPKHLEPLCTPLGTARRFLHRPGSVYGHRRASGSAPRRFRTHRNRRAPGISYEPVPVDPRARGVVPSLHRCLHSRDSHECNR